MKIKIADLDFALCEPTQEEFLPFSFRILHKNEKPRFPEECISLRDTEPPEEVVKYMSETGVWNTIQTESDLLNERLFISKQLIQNPLLFFKEPSHTILASSSKPKPISERRWKFRSLGEKRGVIDSIENFINGLAGAKGISKTAAAIADELFTNAIFNAPFGDLNSTLDRTTLVVLDPDMSAEMIVGSTEDRLFLGCLDLFGTLKCDDLLGRIFNGFKEGISNSINMEKGGAGIGVLRLVDLASDIYVIVEKDKRTLVGCSFVLKKGSRRTRQAAKNFHFQDFQSIESSSGSVRIERRGRRSLFRVSGDLKDDFRFNELDLEGIEEVTLDLMSLKQTDFQIFHILIEICQKTKSIKKLNFEYVPHNNLNNILDIIRQTGAAGEIRSISMPFYCPSCEVLRTLFLVRCDEGTLDYDPPACSKCKVSLKAREKDASKD